MERIRDHNPLKILSVAAMLLLMSIAANAQDTNKLSFPSPQSTNFSDDAGQLADNLVEQTGVSRDKSGQVEQVLIDYRDDLVRFRNNAIANGPDTSSVIPDVTGGRTKADMMGILGDNVDQYYIGVSPSLMADYRDADYRADSKIKDILSDEPARTKYDQIKGQWWKEVKDRVFPSLTENPAQPMK